MFGSSGRLDVHYTQDFPAFYELLAKMVFVRDEDLAFPSGFLEEQLHGRNINMVTITSRINEAITGKLIRASDFGHNAILAYIRPRRARRYETLTIESLEQAGIPVVYIEPKEEAAAS